MRRAVPALVLALCLGGCSLGLGFGNAPDAPNNCPLGTARCN